MYAISSTLGSLEALLEFLKTSKIPVSAVNIGPIHKKDVIKASIMHEHKPEVRTPPDPKASLSTRHLPRGAIRAARVSCPIASASAAVADVPCATGPHACQFATILAFDVPLTDEGAKYAKDLNVKVFTAEIIYHLFDKFTAYMAEVRKEQQDKAFLTAVRCRSSKPMQPQMGCAHLGGRPTLSRLARAAPLMHSASRAGRVGAGLPVRVRDLEPRARLVPRRRRRPHLGGHEYQGGQPAPRHASLRRAARHEGPGDRPAGIPRQYAAAHRRETVHLGCVLLGAGSVAARAVMVPPSFFSLRASARLARGAVGRVIGIEINRKPADIVKQGQSASVKIDAVTSIVFGRQFDHTNQLYSRVTRPSIDALKEFFREECDRNDWDLLVRLKKQCAPPPTARASNAGRKYPCCRVSRRVRARSWRDLRERSVESRVA